MEVYKAIARVSAALAAQGIGKNQKNSSQGFKFRGIDDILNALAPILAENSLVIIPRVISTRRNEKVTDKSYKDDYGDLIKKESVLFYVSVRMEFDIISAEDGSKHTATTESEAMDSGDKATNKAMSAAYKYMAILTFCIPTEGDNDADFQSHEVVKNTFNPSTPSKPFTPKPANQKPVAEGWDSELWAIFDKGFKKCATKDDLAKLEAWVEKNLAKYKPNPRQDREINQIMKNLADQINGRGVDTSKPVKSAEVESVLEEEIGHPVDIDDF